MRAILARAAARGQLRRIDLHVALFLEKLAGNDRPELLLAAALASRAVGEGHICLPLNQVAGKPVFAPEEPACKAPDLSAWREHLLAGGVVGGADGRAPLVLDADDRLYLARYFRCERMIGEDLLRRSRGIAAVDEEVAGQLLTRLFPAPQKIDWQQQAAAVAVLKQFVVISGGPGTGKTHTVARILALLQTLAGGSLRIGLAAPTGKAAARLRESIRTARNTLAPDLAAVVPDETRTLHRLLGFMPRDHAFRHNRDNPLDLDLLVLDEASMIDVPLMAALVEALPAAARLIMLGDRDQLTSVEAGSLFGDICAGREPGWSAPLCRRLQRLTGRAPEPVTREESFADSVVLLRTSYRFAAASGIAALAGAVNSGSRKALAGVMAGRFPDFSMHQVEKENLQQWLVKRIVPGFRDCFVAADPGTALAALARFRILCCVREGATGVAGVNRIAEQALRARGMITGNDPWYRGRPVMITSNHYGLQLFNGDTGILWPDDRDRLWAWFFRADGTLHPVAPARLPAHETAYAITVHKAQGSEFAEVLLILPAQDSRVLCRELIYTGITRARTKLALCGDRHLLDLAVERRVSRYSGLAQRLWSG